LFAIASDRFFKCISTVEAETTAIDLNGFGGCAIITAWALAHATELN